MFIHCTKKAEKVLRESGLFSDRRKKTAFVKEVTARYEMFHWHLNSVDVNGAYLLILTHDISGVAAAFYMKDLSTVKSQLNVFLPLTIEYLCLIAKCSNRFTKELMRLSEKLVYTSAGDPKQISKNTVASRYINKSGLNLEPDEIFQSQLTKSYNDMPKKSLVYQSPNEVLLNESKSWMSDTNR